MSGLITLKEHACFGGVQGFYKHEASTIGLPMKFGVYVPPQAVHQAVPAVVFLAGLTCNEETFAIKAGAQRYAALHGLMLVTPDTSPRDTGVPGADDDWDFGHGAGFYLDAIQPLWRDHWKMASYIVSELPAVLGQHFPLRVGKLGICGHSMGGHGALTLALKHPHLFASVSALAPIASPTRCPWGVKAFERYLGETDHAVWALHDAVELLRAGAKAPPILVDQGLADPFMTEQLQPDLLEAACLEAGQALTLHRHVGSDHSYYFIASVMAGQMAHHASALLA